MNPTFVVSLETDRTILYYSPLLEQAINELFGLITSTPGLAQRGNARWLAIKLLEQDTHVRAQLSSSSAAGPVLARAESLASQLSTSTGEDVDVLIADERYGWINQLTQSVVEKVANGPTATERIDRVVTNRWLGIPIFLMVMYILFRFTSEIPAAYVAWLADVINGPVARWVASVLTIIGLGGSWVESLLLHGILPGVGSVLAFVPVLAALYLGLGILEESGYMARAAFVIDRLMHALGLHGKSFLPMIVGFGCSVPGIYATRTMDNRRERLLTGLLVPFMSCSARLPVYLLLTAIFFPNRAGLVIFGLYLTGIIVAILAGIFLNRTVFRGMPQATSIMEMPAYHKPVWKNIFSQTWERTSGFIRKAGTTILVCSMLVWLLMSIPVHGKGSFAKTPLPESLFAALARVVTPVFAPLGFDSWQTTGALASGIVAKEVIVSTLAQSYGGQIKQSRVISSPVLADVRQIVDGFIQAGVDTFHAIARMIGFNLDGKPVVQAPDAGLSGSMRVGFALSSGGHAGLAGLAFLVFVLLYTPCISTLTAIRHELGGKWMALTATGQFLVAWLAALMVYQLGIVLLGVG